MSTDLTTDPEGPDASTLGTGILMRGCSALLALVFAYWSVSDPPFGLVQALIDGAAALGFAANLKRALHPSVRLVAVLAQLAGLGMFFFLLDVALNMGESGRPISTYWWVGPVSAGALLFCGFGIVGGISLMVLDRRRMAAQR